MKRVVSVVLVLAMVLFALVGCAEKPVSTTETTEPVAAAAEPVSESETKTIGLSMNDLSNPFISYVGEGIKEIAEAAGYEVLTADAASNVQTQITQLENFITMQVDAVFVFATDPVALADTTQKVADAGIKLVTAGGDLAGADVVMNVDQYEWGKASANLMVDWATATFGETTGKVIVIKSTGTSESTKRSNGIIDGLTEAGFNVVVSETEAISATDARTVMENMWQQNSDAIGAVCYASDGAIGVNEYIMGIASVDKSKFGIFACDTSDAVAELINMSATDESVFRGTMGIGGPTIDGESVDLPSGTFTIIDRLINGEEVGYSGDSVVAILPSAE